MQLALETDSAAAAVSLAEREYHRMTAERRQRVREYQTQLEAIDRLKQKRASWSRDRQLKQKLAESQATAAKLEALDQRVRRAQATLETRYRQLLATVGREERALSQAAEAAVVGSDNGRRMQLSRLRKQARGFLRPEVKKIVLPDERIDPLADPEELEYQASLLSQSEDELLRELENMERQAQRYRQMVALRDKRGRADAFGRLDRDDIRRTTGRTNRRAADGDELSADEPEPGSSPAPPAPPPPSGEPSGDRGEGDAPPEDPSGGPGGPSIPEPDTPTPPTDDENFSPPASEDGGAGLDIVLADVVDVPTLDALRTAERSSNPAHKAKAVEQASRQVRARLQRLRLQRQRMQERARQLRRD